MQHQSTTMVCLVLKFSKVKILPKTANQAKKATFKGTFFNLESPYYKY